MAGQSGGQEGRRTGVQEYRSSGGRELRSAGVLHGQAREDVGRNSRTLGLAVSEKHLTGENA
jgi:hypothetical protein